MRSLRNVVGAVLILGVLILAIGVVEFVFRLQEDVVQGEPRLIDGDSIAFGDLNVRLAGIDAPERSQTCRDARGDEFACGRSATDYLRFLVGDQSVTCRGRGTDRYGRMIAVCRANGVDLSEEMVRRGWAVAYLGNLEAVEEEAKSLGVGLWAGEFTTPSEWRVARRSADPTIPLGALREVIARFAAHVSGETTLRAPADG